MPSVLFVLDELPALHSTGQSTYNNAFVTALVSAGYDVTLLITGNRFSSPFFRVRKDVGIERVKCVVPAAIALDDDRHFAKITAFVKWLFRASPLAKLRKNVVRGRTVHIGHWLSRKTAAKSVGLIQGMVFDYVLIDTVFRHPILSALGAQGTRVLVGHDVFHRRCSALAETGLSAVPLVTEEEESSALSQFDGLVAITEEEAEIYRAMQPTKAVLALPSPIAPKVYSSHNNTSQRILYVGSRGQMNVDGLRWFLDLIWPQVIAANPAARLDVVGSVCDAFERTAPGVCFHGRVDDFSAVASTAMFGINPIRAGSGLKIKMLDYFAYGLGCVTTPAGASGFPSTVDSPIEVATSEVVFAQVLGRWLSDPSYCHVQSDKALRYVRQFSPEVFATRLHSWLQSLSSAPVKLSPAKVDA